MSQCCQDVHVCVHQLEPRVIVCSLAVCACMGLHLLCWKYSDLCTVGSYVTYKTYSYRFVASELPADR